MWAQGAHTICCTQSRPRRMDETCRSTQDYSGFRRRWSSLKMPCMSVVMRCAMFRLHVQDHGRCLTHRNLRGRDLLSSHLFLPQKAQHAVAILSSTLSAPRVMPRIRRVGCVANCLPATRTSLIPVADQTDGFSNAHGMPSAFRLSCSWFSITWILGTDFATTTVPSAQVTRSKYALHPSLWLRPFPSVSVAVLGVRLCGSLTPYSFRSHSSTSSLSMYSGTTSQANGASHLPWRSPGGTGIGLGSM